MTSRNDRAQRYWRHNLRYLAVLLSLWFVVSYGAGILFVDALDRIRFFGFGLGFWFAQQGSIFVFVVLIFVYVWLMNRLDRRFGYAESGSPPERSPHATGERAPARDGEPGLERGLERAP